MNQAVSNDELIRARKIWIAKKFGQGATRGDLTFGDKSQPTAVALCGHLLVGKGPNAMIIDPLKFGS